MPHCPTCTCPPEIGLPLCSCPGSYSDLHEPGCDLTALSDEAL